MGLNPTWSQFFAAIECFKENVFLSYSNFLIYMVECTRFYAKAQVIYEFKVTLTFLDLNITLVNDCSFQFAIPVVVLMVTVE